MSLDEGGGREVDASGSIPKLVSSWYLQGCGYPDCPSRWSEYKHVDDDYRALISRTANVPIIQCFTNENRKWVTKSIKIQDGLMREILSEVLKDYQDLDLDVEGYTFKPPFMPLCHRCDTLKEFHENAKDPALKRAALELINFLNPIIAPSIDAIAYTRETGKIKFDDIWQIFAPDTLVSTTFYGVQTTCCVTGYKDERGGWTISLKFVDWNGEKVGFSHTTTTIGYYQGYRRVNLLPVFPISFLENEASYRESMIDRGKTFENLRGYHFMNANGAKITVEGGAPVRRPVSGRVCIDAYAYYTSNNIVKPDLKPLSPSEDSQEETDSGTGPGTGSGAKGSSCISHNDDEDGRYDDKAPKDSKFTDVRIAETPTAERPVKRADDLEPLTDDQRLLATPWVRGFDLKTKQWCELRVDELQPMTWNDEAFDKLVLPGDEKQLAWEFVEAKSLSQSAEFDDFIPDKGRGLLILMFGPPGVGKTFTAEAVADKSRVPLYAMSAAELGTAPDTVEKALESALGLCRMWNAMLLLDEADVFLSARTFDSIARNELVAIFLRMLEYYQGTMFLTTNRVSSIDPAFQSRVDLFLPYHDLSREARRRVWCNFIERAGQQKFDVTDDSLAKLSLLPLNGREIKNLIKSVQLLSIRNGSTISMERLYALAERRVQALAQANQSGN
ncbi:P-loop containing nucleoside triphosphate hydrolase protein [Xylaria venustula]|nr:P-loop containing nucleoside triphosphate hydrolase protein [Xylaria venustula]